MIHDHDQFISTVVFTSDIQYTMQHEIYARPFLRAKKRKGGNFEFSEGANAIFTMEKVSTETR